MEVIPENIKDEGLRFAYQDADKHNWTKEELEAYDFVLMREQDDRGRLTLATKRATEKATKTTLQVVAKKLVRKGLSVTDISETTGLTVDEIQSLQSEE